MPNQLKMNTAELNIEVDENNNKIGLRPKSDFHTGKFIHRSAWLILFNSKNKILLQKRTSGKKWYPNLFTYSVAATVANESYEECINREMQEEIGITIPVKRLFIFKFSDEFDKTFAAVFTAKSDAEIKPDKKEIEKIVWFNAEELKKDIIENSDIYTPPFIEGMKIFFSKYYTDIKTPLDA